MGKEIAAQTGGVSITQAARYGFDNDQIATIRRTVAKDCTEAETLMLLELAGRYELDPFAGEIYAAKMPGRDGAQGAVALIVGKNGMLKVAGRDKAFQGVEADTVYKGDHFKKLSGGNVEHGYEVTEARGKEDILGAWALVHRSDRPHPIYFWADFATYNKGKATWKQFPAAMIRKVAVSNALREAFSLSGLYDESEMGVAVEGEAVEVIEEQPDYGEDEDLAEHLKALFEEANRVKPGSFLPQKVRVRLAGEDQQGRERIAAEVAAFVDAHGGTIPERAPVEDAEVTS